MSSVTSSWRTPGLVLAAGCIILLLSFGIRTAFGLFVVPVSSDLGWGRDVFGLALAIQNIAWGVFQPVLGAVADRYGAFRVLLIGSIVYVLGLVLMANVETPLMLHLSAGLLTGFAVAGTAFGIVLAAITRIVDEKHRSLALGLGTAVGSAGQFLMVGVGQGLLNSFEWPMAMLLLAACSGLMVVLSFMFVGAGAGSASAQLTREEQSIADAIKEASKHSGFLYLTAGFFVCGFHVAFISAHLPAYVIDLGLAPEIGAAALMLVGLFNIVGSFLAGWAGGRFPKRLTLSLIYFGRAVVIAVFVMLPPSATTVLVFSSVMGLLWLSTVPLTSGIVAQVFGTKYMSMLFGFVFFSHQVGSFLGVWLGGVLFEAYGSYEVVWWAGAALGVFAGLVHLPIDEKPVARLSPTPAPA